MFICPYCKNPVGGGTTPARELKKICDRCGESPTLWEYVPDEPAAWTREPED